MDALLVLLAFWLGGVIRVWLGYSAPDEELLQSMNWVLYIAVPFTPLALERSGFYDRLRHKSTRAAVWQLLQSLLVIALIVALFAVFAQVTGTRRLILGSGLILMFVLILLLDRAKHRWMKQSVLSDSAK